ncbi:MAG: hypothetical protein AAGA56_01165, partial [Myxococcota bacterium]
VVLYQVFGRKRVFVIGAERGSVMDPMANFATLRLAELSDEKRRELMHRTGGYETVIGPGEAIAIPAWMWHGVDYLEHGLSVNYRFGRHRYHRFISRNLHLSEATQRLGALTLEAETLEAGPWRRGWEALIQCFRRPTTTPWERYLELEALLAAHLPAPVPIRRDGLVYAPLPPVAREALPRLHLFQEQLYLHRTPFPEPELVLPA